MSNLVESARALMLLAHKGQRDRGGNPYNLHPEHVANSLCTDDEELFCIALLHDVIEDGGITDEMMSAHGMTPRVIAGVSALTKIPEQSLEEYKTTVMSNADATIVKRADLTHNMDLTRLKKITQKDIDRNLQYQRFLNQLNQ